ncbi:hypothetical protein [Paraherbaspirillum soli]|uniref:DUF3077 domain-containing protein n=1 Tax=Paraherbaspirillum soli TaxID=631222 RepID=A0ABW0MD01_9BURK
MTTSTKKFKQFPPIPETADLQPFSWLDKDLRTDPAAHFIELSLDMSQGIRKCLAALHANALAQEHGDPACPPPLNAYDIDVMFRWALASADVMAEKAQASVDYLNAWKARQRKA